MIKINVIINNSKWSQYIKYPDQYIKLKTVRFNKKDVILKKNFFFFNLLLSNSNHIKKLNKKFRQKNRSTDILSFPFQTKIDLKKNIKTEKQIYLGDIIINLGKIKDKKDIKKFKYNFDQLWVHGLVHLLGYDHKKESDYQSMLRIEKKFRSYLS